LLFHHELNAEPSAETRALFEQIRAQARQQAQEAPLGPTLLASARLPSAPVAADRREPVLPHGTLTFLFTEVESLAEFADAQTEGLSEALAHPANLLRQAIAQHNGHVFKTLGGACCAAFHTAQDALTAALAAQTVLNHRG